MPKSGSHGSPSTSRPGSSTGGRTGSGYSAEPSALDSMSSKLDSLGSELTGMGSKAGSAHPGSSAFGVVGQSLAGKLTSTLSTVEHHVGKIGDATRSAGSKVKATAGDLRNAERHNGGLFDSIGGQLSTSFASKRSGRGSASGGTGTRSGRAPGNTTTPRTGGPIRTGRSRPSGGTPYGRPPGGSGRPPRPAPPATPLNPTVPQATHNHVINGDWNANQNKPTGGHVLDSDASGYHNPNPSRYGYGLVGNQNTGTPWPNGVYDINQPEIRYDPTYGNLSKPGMSTVFPQGVPASTVEQIGNNAAQEAAANGTFGNNKWSGSTTIPHYDYPHAPGETPPYPYVGGQSINIQGYYNSNNGQASTYYPSSKQ